MIKMKAGVTLAQAWGLFNIAVLGDPAKPNAIGMLQRLEMRKAFYAGASCLFDIMMVNSDVPDAEAEGYLQALHAEIGAFAQGLQQDNPPTGFDWKGEV